MAKANDDEQRRRKQAEANAYHKPKKGTPEWQKLPLTRRTGITRTKMPDKSYRDQEKFKHGNPDILGFAKDYQKYQNRMKTAGTGGGSATEDAITHYDKRMAKKWGADWKKKRLPQLEKFQKLRADAKDANLGSYTNLNTKRVVPYKKPGMSDEDRIKREGLRADATTKSLGHLSKAGKNDNSLTPGVAGSQPGLSPEDAIKASQGIGRALFPEKKATSERLPLPDLPSDPKSKAMRYRFGSIEDIQGLRDTANIEQAKEYVDAFKTVGFTPDRQAAFIANRLHPDMQKAVQAAMSTESSTAKPKKKVAVKKVDTPKVDGTTPQKFKVSKSEQAKHAALKAGNKANPRESLAKKWPYVGKGFGDVKAALNRVPGKKESYPSSSWNLREMLAPKGQPRDVAMPSLRPMQRETTQLNSLTNMFSPSSTPRNPRETLGQEFQMPSHMAGNEMRGLDLSGSQGALLQSMASNVNDIATGVIGEAEGLEMMYSRFEALLKSGMSYENARSAMQSLISRAGLGGSGFNAPSLMQR